jgi:tRNA-Thr(GGU) m(6)t(6)A37 methyltransferase TsaA
MKISFKAIGKIMTPFDTLEGMPIQSVAAKNVEGTIQLDPLYIQGIKDLDGFSHLILIYYFHKIHEYTLQVVPFLDDEPHGIFATRFPKRPNPIGFSVVRLKSIEGNNIHVLDVDVLNETPLLDIKPYVPLFDAGETSKIGWFEKRIQNVHKVKADKSVY